MKRNITLVLIAVLLCFTGNIEAQDKSAEKKNLIVNGGFETANTDKIKKLGQFALCSSWTTATGEKVDLFSKLSTYPEVGAPNNVMGVSNPKEGNNYIGLVTHIVASKDGREYITAPLDGYLEKGKKYCLSYSISLADGAKYATNNLGFHFSKKPVFEEDKTVILLDDVIYPLNNRPQKNRDSWEDICITFNAVGFEKYVTIGNFAPATRTVTERVARSESFKGDQQQIGYYFLDNISLVKIDRESECSCEDKDDLEGPRIIFSKTNAFLDKASTEDKIKAKTVYFYSNEDELAGATLKELNMLIGLLKSNPTVNLTISGHMDEKEVIRGQQFDVFKDLSKTRAEKVKQYLVDQGVSSSRLRLESHKADEPATEMKTPLSMARNRRVEFSVR
jgi:outer membrane protein OmpA-like peptidoglycan-associated protein